MAGTAVSENRGLVESVVATLRQRILTGEFGSDGMLPSQADVAAELGVSRSIVREGMRMLESQGLLEISQGRKPRVRPASPDRLADSIRLLLSRGALSLGQLSEVRRPLETEVAALAARRASPALLDALTEALADLRTARRLNDQIAADQRFHELLAEASGNPIFRMLLEALADLLYESRRRTIGNVGVGPAVRGHEAILAAVVHGDSEAARSAMQQHLDEAARDLWVDGSGRKH